MQAAGSAESRGALAGLKVVDASSIIAGPLCAMVLGDLGADVLKVEPPEGDPLRTHGPFKNGHSLYWKVLGRNKHSLVLDLREELGRDRFRQICGNADIVILGFREETLARWGLAPGELRRLNDQLIVATVSAYGTQGPLRSAAGFGTLAEAMSGFTYRNGSPDGDPTLPPFGLADGVAGLSLAIGVLAAVRARETYGVGQRITVSLTDPLITLLTPQDTYFHATNSVMERTGNRSESSGPRGLYRAKDGAFVALSCSTAGPAANLFRLIGRPEIIDEDWFRVSFERAQRSDYLDAIIRPWVADRDAAEAVDLLRAAGVPAGPVHNSATLATDEQFVANGVLTELPDPELGTVVMPAPFLRLSETPGRIKWPGPGLGDVEYDVLEDFGLTPDSSDNAR